MLVGYIFANDANAVAVGKVAVSASAALLGLTCGPVFPTYKPMEPQNLRSFSAYGYEPSVLRLTQDFCAAVDLRCSGAAAPARSLCDSPHKRLPAISMISSESRIQSISWLTKRS